MVPFHKPGKCFETKLKTLLPGIKKRQAKKPALQFLFIINILNFFFAWHKEV